MHAHLCPILVGILLAGPYVPHSWILSPKGHLYKHQWISDWGALPTYSYSMWSVYFWIIEIPCYNCVGVIILWYLLQVIKYLKVNTFCTGWAPIHTTSQQHVVTFSLMCSQMLSSYMLTCSTGSNNNNNLMLHNDGSRWFPLKHIYWSVPCFLLKWNWFG